LSGHNANRKPSRIKRYAPLVAVAGIVIAIMAGAYLVEPGLGIFRHGDPSQTKGGMPSAVDLALMYSSIFGSISEEGFTNATALLQELDSAYVPESLAYTFSRFNTLLLMEISDFNITGARIADAIRQYAVGNAGAAGIDITNATWTLAKSNITLSDLASAADELSKQFKMRSLAPELQMLLELIGRYADEIADVNASIGEIESGNLTATSITLGVGSHELITGGWTWAAGTLSAANGTALPGMPVVVYAGGSAIMATTDSAGAFSVPVHASGYVENMTVAAAFLPQSGYVGCASGEETILVNYIAPAITVALGSGSVLPQGSFTATVSVDLSRWVHGNFSTALPTAQGAVVEVSAFGRLSYAYVEGAGSSANATIMLTVPYGTASGSWDIRVSAVPIGVVGPGEGSSSITVYRMPTTVSLSAPGWALGGTGIPLTGTAQANGTGLSQARVTAYISYSGGQTAVVETITDGSGNFALAVPTGAFTPSGAVAMNVQVMPDEDEFAKGAGSAQSYLISPALLAVPVAALGAVGGGLALRRPRRPESGAEEVAQSAVAIAATAAARTMPPEGTVAGAYARAASWIGSLMGRRMRASETVREYYSRVEPGLGDARVPFRGLTGMLEDALYGLKEVSAPAAKGLFERVKELLGLGKGRSGSGSKSGNGKGDSTIMNDNKSRSSRSSGNSTGSVSSNGTENGNAPK
jgi:hypothetical protein